MESIEKYKEKYVGKIYKSEYYKDFLDGYDGSDLMVKDIIKNPSEYNCDCCVSLLVVLQYTINNVTDVVNMMVEEFQEGIDDGYIIEICEHDYEIIRSAVGIIRVCKKCGNS